MLSKCSLGSQCVPCELLARDETPSLPIHRPAWVVIQTLPSQVSASGLCACQHMMGKWKKGRLKTKPDQTFYNNLVEEPDGGPASMLRDLYVRSHWDLRQVLRRSPCPCSHFTDEQSSESSWWPRDVCPAVSSSQTLPLSHDSQEKSPESPSSGDGGRYVHVLAECVPSLIFSAFTYIRQI